jgi:hypothetical protein
MITDWGEYQEMRAAWELRGFGAALCEFLVCDNSTCNEFSAFEAVRGFLQQASGRYVLIAHTDVTPLETAEKLLERIEGVQKSDPRWGVIGNAGIASGRCEMALEMPGRRSRLRKPWMRVSVIDENLMIVKNGSGITVSADLAGYHFYAFDLCSVAERLGYSVYVVDCLWHHRSEGTLCSEFFEAKELVEKKMRRLYRGDTVETTCATLCWSDRKWRRALSTAKGLYIAEAGAHTHAVRVLRHEGGRLGLFFVLCWAPWAVRLWLGRRRRGV